MCAKLHIKSEIITSFGGIFFGIVFLNETALRNLLIKNFI